MARSFAPCRSGSSGTRQHQRAAASLVVRALPAARQRRRDGLRVATALTILALAGCRGPNLTVEGDGQRFVDGRALAVSTLPFRYYGTAVVDVLPRGESGPQQWSRAPARVRVEVAPPAPWWLFPLDLPIELVARLAGPGDQTVTVTLPPAPEVVAEGFVPDLQPLRERAFAARVQR